MRSKRGVLLFFLSLFFLLFYLLLFFYTYIHLYGSYLQYRRTRRLVWLNSDARHDSEETWVESAGGYLGPAVDVDMHMHMCSVHGSRSGSMCIHIYRAD